MIRGLWNRETVAALLLASYMPMALMWVVYGGSAAATRLGLTLLVIGIWHLIFMLVRAQAPSLSAIVAALAIAMLAPEGLGALRLVLGVSFGVVMGELAFGGWGRNVVNPATIALSFLGFGSPAFGWPTFDAPVAWAAIPAALIGMATGVMPAGVIGGAGLIGAIGAVLGVVPISMLHVGGLVLVVLVADPVTSAATQAGRWLEGALYSALLMLFTTSWHGAAPVQMAVAAALLASLAAPVVDEAVLADWVARRRRHHGRP